LYRTVAIERPGTFFQHALIVFNRIYLRFSCRSPVKIRILSYIISLSRHSCFRRSLLLVHHFALPPEFFFGGVSIYAPGGRNGSDNKLKTQRSWAMRVQKRDRLHPNAVENAVLESFVRQVFSLAQAEGAVIALRDAEDLLCRASVGDAPAVGSKVGVESWFTQQCLDTSQVVICQDAQTDEHFQTTANGGLPFRSAAAIPIEAHGVVLGVMEFFSKRPSAFNADQIAEAQRHAALLGLLLDEPNLKKEEEAPVVQNQRGQVVMFPAPHIVPVRGKTWLPHISQTQARIAVATAMALLVLVGILTTQHYQEGARLATAGAPSASNSLQHAPEIAGKVEKAQSEQTAAAANTSAGEDGTGNPMAAKDRRVSGNPTFAIPAREQLDTSSADERGHAPAKGAGISVAAESARTKSDLPQPSTLPLEPPPSDAEIAKVTPAALPAFASATPLPIAPAPVTAAVSRGFVLDRTLKGHSSWVTAVAFSPDGRRLASGSWDSTVKFWDVATGAPVRSISNKTGKVQALAFSADGRWLAGESYSNEVTVWDAHTGAAAHTLAGSKPMGLFGGNNYVYSIDFSADGRWLGSAVDDRTVRVWDVKTWQVLRDLFGPPRKVIYIALSPDGRLLATGGENNTIAIWDVAAGRVIHTLQGHREQVYAVQFSPDGRRLASASRDKTVKLWDVAGGREIRTLNGHRKSVTSLAFRPDGKLLASGSWDDTIKLWDTESGRELQTLAGHTHHVYSVAFDADGRWLASGSEDGTMKLWKSK